MDFTTILGIIALAVSILSLWRGWRSDAVIKKLSDDFNQVNERHSTQNERQSNQIDALIEVVRLQATRF